MIKCGWCSRKYLDTPEGKKCVCGWRFPDSGAISLMRANHALQQLKGEKTPANDISFWQRRPDGPPNDFDKMATKSRGVWIKKSQATRKDRDGDANYAWARGKIARGGYHYLDWTKPAIDQVDFFWGTFTVNGVFDLGELSPWLDYEEWQGAPDPGTARLFFKTAVERLSYHLAGVGWAQKPGNYTSPGYWATFGSPDQWWADHLDLMIAHYGVSTPTIPRPWITHCVHQWGFGDGPAHGVQSLEIDMDDFNGGLSAWNSYALPLPGSTPPPEPPEGEIMQNYQVVNSAGVNLRTAPNTSAEIKAIWPYAGTLTGTGAVNSVNNLNAWVQVTHPTLGPLWAALVYEGRRYLKTV